MQRTHRTRSRARGGFTLMEVLLVLAILGVIGALVVPNLLGSQQTANIKAARNDIKRIEAAVGIYAQDHAGTPPTDFSALTEPYEKEGIQNDPVLEAIPKDPWGNEYNYKYDTNGSGHQKLKTKADIWSSGPDGNNDNGSGDDVNNWSHLEGGDK